MGTEQTFEKAVRNWHNSIRSGSNESIQNISCFSVVLLCNIRTQTGYYKQEICHLFANFLGCSNTKYY